MPLRTSRNLLDHSFYRRWLSGTLTVPELRDYALQYAHVVKALPEWLRLSAAPSDHVDEERRHLELWYDFALAVGASRSEVDAVEPNAATQALLRRGRELSEGPAGVGVAWAVESQSGPVSREKLSGLAEHYGIDGGAGAEYFRLHATLDVAHTEELESRLAQLDPADVERAQAASNAVQEALWNLLSSVEQAA